MARYEQRSTISLEIDRPEMHFFRVESVDSVFHYAEAEKGGFMLKLRLVVASLGFAMILPASSVLFAQAANNTPAAPLPSQILTAKKVFIANIGEGSNLRVWSGGPDRMYNELYAALKGSGRYELVTAPADSDLLVEVKVVANTLDWQFKLVLLDPKTQTPLWTIDEPIKITGLQKTRDKNFDDTINKLVSDLKALTAAPASK
jgi:hypothetical protein